MSNDVQSRRRFRLQFGIDDYVPGSDVTVRNLVLMQKGHTFNELGVQGLNVVRTVMKSQALINGQSPGQHDERFTNTEVDDFKQWDRMIQLMAP